MATHAPADYLDLEEFEHRVIFAGLDNVWDALPKIVEHLMPLVGAPSLIEGKCSPLAHIDETGVVIKSGAVVEAGAVVKGPAIIGEGTQIRAGAYVRGNAIIGNGVVIGNSCEIKNSIIFNSAEVPHYNYVGDAILGHKAHLGAGVILSNVRLDRQPVSFYSEDGTRVSTGLRKFSAVIGDRAEVGCNCVISPGALIGRGSILYPLTHWQGILPAGKMVKHRQNLEVVDMLGKSEA